MKNATTTQQYPNLANMITVLAEQMADEGFVLKPQDEWQWPEEAAEYEEAAAMLTPYQQERLVNNDEYPQDLGADELYGISHALSDFIQRVYGQWPHSSPVDEPYLTSWCLTPRFFTAESIGDKRPC